jgi:hypothetical protein
MTQFIKTILTGFIILTVSISLFSQSTYLPLNSKSDHFLDRLGILMQTDPDLNVFTPKPLSRKLAVQIAERADSLSRFYPYDDYYHLGKIDQHNLQSLLMNNIEWVSGSKEAFKSKHTLWNTIYPTKANFFEVNAKDFFLAVNPVLNLQIAHETGNSERVFLNSKGLEFRGLLANKIGFSSYIVDNQERGPTFFQQRVIETGFPAVPGAGYYKPFKTTAFDYFDARASINFNLIKYLDFQFGYDKNFIGNGYRSFFLSDFSAPYLFLKINTRVWKLNYQILYMELINQHQLGDYQYPKKYATMHHLSINAAKWLNLGMFDNIVFSRADHFEFSYLNPIIFLVSAQQQNGSPDKTTIGLDFKMNIGHVTQVYGQLLINEFVLHEVLHYSNGWWGNKQGIQLGVKYIDMFNVKNLDLQVEGNLMRPYTYSHNDSVSNYSNYNQPLAHPLGANFGEFIGILRYQPAYKWTVMGRFIYFKQGLDSAGVNFGSNIFLNYETRPRDYGFFIGSGIPATCTNTSLQVSYEWKENLFLDFSALYRSYTIHNPGAPSTNANSATFSIGIRVNAPRREYDY